MTFKQPKLVENQCYQYAAIRRIPIRSTTVRSNLRIFRTSARLFCGVAQAALRGKRRKEFSDLSVLADPDKRSASVGQFLQEGTRFSSKRIQIKIRLRYRHARDMSIQRKNNANLLAVNKAHYKTTRRSSRSKWMRSMKNPSVMRCTFSKSLCVQSMLLGWIVHHRGRSIQEKSCEWSANHQILRRRLRTIQTRSR